MNMYIQFYKDIFKDNYKDAIVPADVGNTVNAILSSSDYDDRDRDVIRTVAAAVPGFKRKTIFGLSDKYHVTEERIRQIYRRGCAVAYEKHLSELVWGYAGHKKIADKNQAEIEERVKINGKNITGDLIDHLTHTYVTDLDIDGRLRNRFRSVRSDSVLNDRSLFNLIMVDKEQLKNNPHFGDFCVNEIYRVATIEIKKYCDLDAEEFRKAYSTMVVKRAVSTGL